MKIGRWTTCIGLTVLAGCHAGLNSSVSPGQEPLPAFAETTTAVAPSDTPSLTAGHDRSHWSGQTVTVATGSVAHPPRYTTWAMSTDPPLADAVYPTAQSALDHAEPTPNPAADMTLRILAGYGEMIGLPVELFVTPPPTVEYSPTGSFQRVPEIEDTRPLTRWFPADAELSPTTPVEWPLTPAAPETEPPPGG